jgi:hypothetical protein
MPRVFVKAFRRKNLDTFDRSLGRQGDQLRHFQKVEPQGSHLLARSFVATRLIVEASAYEGTPMGLKLMVELVGDAGRSAAISVLGDPHLGRMLDDSPGVEDGEFGRDAPNEVPCAMAAGEKVRHDATPLLDVLLDVLLDARHPTTHHAPTGTVAA